MSLRRWWASRERGVRVLFWVAQGFGLRGILQRMLGHGSRAEAVAVVAVWAAVAVLLLLVPGKGRRRE